MNRVKAFVAFLLCVILAFSASSCSGKDSVKINNVEIDKGIYMYWLSVAVQDYASLSEEEKSDDMYGWIIDKTLDYCVSYAAVHEKFKSENLTLTGTQKSNIAESVNNRWIYYGDFFKKIGVTKADYYKIFEYDEYQNSLFMDMYQSGGAYAVSDDDIKTYLKENFILFDSIVGYKTETDESGNSVPISDSAKQTLLNNFNNMAKKINDKTMTFAQVSYQYASNITLTDDEVKALTIDESSVTPNIININSTSYPEGFFAKVQELEYETAQVIEYDNYVYLVIRHDILAEGTSYFDDYSQWCLRAMKSDDFNEKLESWKSEIDTSNVVLPIEETDIDAILELL